MRGCLWSLSFDSVDRLCSFEHPFWGSRQVHCNGAVLVVGWRQAAGGEMQFIKFMMNERIADRQRCLRGEELNRWVAHDPIEAYRCLSASTSIRQTREDIGGLQDHCSSTPTSPSGMIPAFFIITNSAPCSLFNMSVMLKISGKCAPRRPYYIQSNASLNGYNKVCGYSSRQTHIISTKNIGAPFERIFWTGELFRVTSIWVKKRT